MTKYVVVPLKATEAMFIAAMFDTRQPPDLIWDAMVQAAEPRALESVTKEYFKAGSEWERRLHEGHLERTISELIEKAEADSKTPEAQREDVNIPAAAKYWLEYWLKEESG